MMWLALHAWEMVKSHSISSKICFNRSKRHQSILRHVASAKSSRPVALCPSVTRAASNCVQFVSLRIIMSSSTKWGWPQMCNPFGILTARNKFLNSPLNPSVLPGWDGVGNKLRQNGAFRNNKHRLCKMMPSLPNVSRPKKMRQSRNREASSKPTISC